MSFFGNPDLTLKVGDLVTTNYYKGNKIYRITEIQRRFYTKHDPDWMRQGDAIGDEYNPIVTMQVVINPHGPVRKESRVLDISYVKRFDKAAAKKQAKEMQNKIRELEKIE